MGGSEVGGSEERGRTREAVLRDLVSQLLLRLVELPLGELLDLRRRREVSSSSRSPNRQRRTSSSPSVFLLFFLPAFSSSSSPLEPRIALSFLLQSNPSAHSRTLKLSAVPAETSVGPRTPKTAKAVRRTLEMLGMWEAERSEGEAAWRVEARVCHAAAKAETRASTNSPLSATVSSLVSWAKERRRAGRTAERVFARGPEEQAFESFERLLVPLLLVITFVGRKTRDRIESGIPFKLGASLFAWESFCASH